ncbi:hypothetical protein [Sorangium cellulosum]|uniref:hypothetical protein n=1 Tax=Sorangium cellulosum TaxID=56 RepID=UPI000ACB2894|nr:hypothetical protein [Sorangium cellulosum]
MPYPSAQTSPASAATGSENGGSTPTTRHPMSVATTPPTTTREGLSVRPIGAAVPNPPG